jgi:hypothetical protein
LQRRARTLFPFEQTLSWRWILGKDKRAPHRTHSLGDFDFPKFSWMDVFLIKPRPEAILQQLSVELSYDGLVLRRMTQEHSNWADGRVVARHTDTAISYLHIEVCTSIYGTFFVSGTDSGVLIEFKLSRNGVTSTRMKPSGMRRGATA